MSFGLPPESRRTLALRLTLWYAAIFALTSLAALVIVYSQVAGLVAQRTDDDLQSDIEEYAALWRNEGLARVRHEMALDTAGDEAARAYFRVWSLQGQLLASTDLADWPALPPVSPASLRAAGDDGPAGDPPLATLRLPPRPDRARTVIGPLGPGVALEIGQSLADDDAFVASILRRLLCTLAGVLLLGGPIGWFMAGRALRGVRQLTRAADLIAAGALQQRVPVGPRGDELDRLAHSFNTMLDRIEALIVGLRDMADTLAHDLRSPLTRIRASAELSLSQPPAAGARDTWAGTTIEACDRLLEMLNTTLDIAEADAGATRLNLGSVDLAELVRDACELFQSVAEDKRVALLAEAPPQLPFWCDRPRLQRVIANLLDNAIKYTPEGGRVVISLQEVAGGRVLLRVADNGSGIAADDLPRIFQRFYRADPARPHGGVGLGLSLAAAFVRLHGGEISVASAPGRGSCFTVALPVLRPRTAETTAPTAGVNLPHARAT